MKAKTECLDIRWPRISIPTMPVCCLGRLAGGSSSGASIAVLMAIVGAEYLVRAKKQSDFD